MARPLPEFPTASDIQGRIDDLKAEQDNALSLGAVAAIETEIRELRVWMVNIRLAINYGA